MRNIKLLNNPYLQWVEARIRKNKNAIIVINGSTGSGKTFAAIDFCLDLARRLNTNFTLKDNMDFSFSGLLMKMNLPINNRPGTVFLFEEVGVVGGGASSREWQSKANSFFQSFMQTSRHKNQILIMTTPMFSFLEKGMRELCHLQITMKQINQVIGTSIGKPFILQSNPISGKLYFKYLRITYGGRRLKVKEITFKLPPQEITSQYETMKTKFTSELNKKILESSIPQDKKPHPSKLDIDWDEFGRYIELKLSYPKIAKIFGVSLATINRKAKEYREKSQKEANLLRKSGFEPISRAITTPLS